MVLKTLFKKVLKDIHILSLVFIIILLFSSWFLNYGTITTGDWMYLSIKKLGDFFSIPYIWDQEYLGRINLLLSNYPVNFIWGLSSKLISYEVSERIFFLFFGSIANSLGFYYLAKHITKNKIASIFGSLFYSFNTYFLVSLASGHINLYCAVGLLPISFLFFIKSIEQKLLKHSLYSAFLLTIMSFYDFRFFYLTLIIFLLYSIFNGLWVQTKQKKKHLINSIKILFILIFIVLSINSFWLLPSLFLGSISDNPIFNRQLFGSEYFDILYSLTLQHPYHSIGKVIHFVRNPINLIFFSIPFISILSIWKLKDKRVWFFVTLSLIGIFLSKQESNPGTWIYGWLYQNIIGFNAFREAGKFYVLTAFSYSLLLSFLLADFAKLKNILLSRTLIILTILIFVTPTIFSFILGATNPILFNRTIPTSYEKVNNYISSDSENFRTLWFPARSRWIYYSDQHPILSFDEYSKLVNIYEHFGVDETNTSIIKLLTDFGKEREFAEIIRSSNIKYIGVPIREKVNDDDFYRFYDSNPQDYITILDDLGYLKIINEDFDGVKLYEVKDYEAYISASEKLINTPPSDIFEYYNFINSNPKLKDQLTTDLSTNFTYDLQIPFNINQTFDKAFEYKLNTDKSNTLYINSSIFDINTYFSNQFLIIEITNPSNIVDQNNNPVIDVSSLNSHTYNLEIEDNVSVSLLINNEEYKLANGNQNIYRGKLTNEIILKKADTNGKILEESILLKKEEVPSNNTYYAQKLNAQYIKYIAQNSNFSNIIKNSDFEKELWQTQVSDCNNFDNNPIIDMRRITDESDNNYLSLESTRHNACTSTNISLEKGKTYRIAFDYQSNNATEIGYFIELDESNNYEKKFTKKDKGWVRYYDTFKATSNNNNASLTVYSLATNFKQNIITNFDNFEITEVPDLNSLFYITSESDTKTSIPSNLSFDVISPVEKKVIVESAKDPFFLKLSESFHTGWDIYINNTKINSENLKVDENFNGWLIDPEQICSNYNCSENLDGSYDFILTLYFTPQKWVYIGGIISLTVVGLLSIITLLLKFAPIQTHAFDNTLYKINTDLNQTSYKIKNRIKIPLIIFLCGFLTLVLNLQFQYLIFLGIYLILNSINIKRVYLYFLPTILLLATAFSYIALLNFSLAEFFGICLFINLLLNLCIELIIIFFENNKSKANKQNLQFLEP